MRLGPGASLSVERAEKASHILLDCQQWAAGGVQMLSCVQVLASVSRGSTVQSGVERVYWKGHSSPSLRALQARNLYRGQHEIEETLDFSPAPGCTSRGSALGLHQNRAPWASFALQFYFLEAKFLHSLVKFLT